MGSMESNLACRACVCVFILILEGSSMSTDLIDRSRRRKSHGPWKKLEADEAH